MALAVSLTPWFPASLGDGASPCTVSFGDVQRQPELRRRLSRMLSSALFEIPDPRLSWLYQVDFKDSRVLLRFEPGQGTLEQQAQAGARGARRLPLPFLWSLRTINAAAATDLPRGLSEFSANAVLTIGGGEARLNAALIDCDSEPKRPNVLAPQCLVRTFASCIGARDPALQLAIQRPILPSGLLQVVAESRTRTRVGTSWHDERNLLCGLERRLQGQFCLPPQTTACSPNDLVRRQLGLLGALSQLEGKPAVDAYFESNLERWQAQSEFRSALRAWRHDGKLSTAVGRSLSRQSAQREREAATHARVAQARLEFRRRDRNVALAFAVDAVCAAPEAPEAWLALGEMRIAEARGSAALCFSEAICAARGERETIAAVQKQLNLKTETELAAYFRAHGDFVLADWLDPENSGSVSPSLAIH